MKFGSLLIGAAALTLVAGCGSKKADDPVAAQKFLKWSMDQNGALKSYRSVDSWSISGGGQKGFKERREIAYAAPNKFKVVTTSEGSGKAVSLTCVSDGTKVLEYSDGAHPAVKYDAPQAISQVETNMMSRPATAGSLLYQFFGGSDNYDGLVDAAKGQVRFGADEKAPNGEDAKTVKFYATGPYGNTEALIGSKTGTVYRIKFDYDGIRDQVKDSPEYRQVNGELPTSEEDFSEISLNEQLSMAGFECKPPKGAEIKDAAELMQPPSPLPVGSKAPDGEVTSLDGKKVRISSLKGKIVMIDFWATWCGPCKKSLPNTEQIAKLYGSKGLQVMAISNEDKDTVQSFIKENSYTFPVFLDTTKQVGSAYRVDGIPCVVIIDAKGNISSYTVGLVPESVEMKNLEKAGLKP